MRDLDGASTAVLVEGLSDRLAFETLAARRDVNLAANGIAIVAMGGARSIRRFVEQLGPRGRGLKLAGLCDAGEEGDYRRGLQRGGVGAPQSGDDLEALGFFVCNSDLEDELIRCLGPHTVMQLLDTQGDLESFRRFQKQPAHRDEADQARLRRFMGTRSGRKLRYASLLVQALDLDNLPRPLDLLLTHVTAKP